ncbi:MAG: FAD-dependent oxidoreductase [Eubacteriales bacterium]
MKNKKVLIIGGVAGGATAAARLRRLDENAEIVMFERGGYISYANCGLPYYIGGSIDKKSALTLQTPESFNSRYNVDVRILSEVKSIDRAAKRVSVVNLRTGDEYTMDYDKLILSPGAEPFRPDIDGMCSSKVFTLRTVNDTLKIKDFINDQKPKTAAVIGGGYIGIEMVENLKEAGLDVSVIELSNQVLAPFDYDMACDLHNHLREKGVKLLLGDSVKQIKEDENGLELTLSSGTLRTDLLIVAIGVRPDTLMARSSGIAVNERGYIITDEKMLTSDPDIYAVGDAIEVTDYVSGAKAAIPLAGPANKQGRIAADNICGIESKYKGTQGSAILKVFDMTAAATGMNEKMAKRLGVNYEKSFTYSASHAGYYPGAVNMSVKILFEKTTGKLLGAQVIGFDGVDKRCDVFATAIRAGMSVGDLTELELCYAPPYSSAKDPVNMAGYVAQNLLGGKAKLFHWHDIDTLQKDAGVTLLDTRTPGEYANGHIDGFINIPLDELRKRVGELDKSKKTYVTCQVGLRGYVACRILSTHGFDCYNLSGGYRLYRSIHMPVRPADNIGINTETQLPEKPDKEDRTKIKVNACGLQCPGPVMKLSEAIKDAGEGTEIEISTTDPAFASDLEGYCRRTGNRLVSLSSSKGVCTAVIAKGQKQTEQPAAPCAEKDGKNIIVFSGDLDKAIASFIIANTAAAMGRKVTMFFTFWGLNILRRAQKVRVKKDFMSRMFGGMMPRGSKKLKLSKMSMGGMGGAMIRGVMKKKNISSLEELISSAQAAGVELVACSMSMDVMGISAEELIDGVKLGGAARMLSSAEESDMSLFI